MNWKLCAQFACYRLRKILNGFVRVRYNGRSTKTIEILMYFNWRGNACIISNCTIRWNQIFFIFIINNLQSIKSSRAPLKEHFICYFFCLAKVYFRFKYLSCKLKKNSYQISRVQSNPGNTFDILKMQNEKQKYIP